MLSVVAAIATLLGFIVALLFMVIVLTVCWRVLADMGFHGVPRGILAVCVALLSVLGLVVPVRVVAVGDGQVSLPSINVLLIPYAALGISILLSLLLTWFFNRSVRRTDRTPRREWRQSRDGGLRQSILPGQRRGRGR